ncbi:MAG: hypothetical protein KGS61_15355 [Verrucomicrobia bacterium]|nr:hypothetical protein [Verrucomicrobiota bacterium]
MAVVLARSAGAAGPLDQWTAISPLPSGSPLNGLVCANGQFVVAGDAGTILTSPDALAWFQQNPNLTNHNAGGNNRLSAVAYGNGQFVVVGAAYDSFGGFRSPLLLTSADGTNWMQHSVKAGVPLTDVAYGNGAFVTVGGGLQPGTNTYVGVILTSPDGVTWSRAFSTLATSAASYPTQLIYGDNQFVAVGYGGTVLTSPDGNAWTAQTSGTTDQLNAIAYGDHQFVALWTDWPPGGTLDSGILASSNGVTWVVRDLDTTNRLTGITFANNQFVAVGFAFAPNGFLDAILTSPDAITWKPQSLGTHAEPQGVAYGDARFVAVGGQGSVLVSGEVTTLNLALLPGGAIQGLIAGSSGQTNIVEVSTNLVDWTTLTNLVTTNGTASFTDVAAPGAQQRFYRAKTPPDPLSPKESIRIRCRLRNLLPSNKICRNHGSFGAL